MTALLAGPPIFLTAAFVGLVGSVLLARASAMGVEAQASPVPRAWVTAAFLQAATSLGHALRGELPTWFVFSAVNTAQILALGLLWLGVQRMARRPVPGWIAAVPALLWFAASLVPGLMDSQRMRLIVFVPLCYGTAFLAAGALLGLHRREGVRAALDMAALVAGVAAVLLAMVLHTIAVPRLPDAANALFSGLPALLTALFVITLPFLMLAVTREWDARREGERRAAALQAGRAEVQRLHAGLPAVLFLARVAATDGTLRAQTLYQGGDVAAVLGWPAGEHAGELLPTHDAARLEEHLRRTIEGGEHAWEWRMRRADGSWSWIRTRARRLARLADGSSEIAGYHLNMDREREAEARALAAARMASVGEMASGLAHELRQPLQSISLAAELAAMSLDAAETDAARERLARIVDQTQRASALIERLRRFARGMEGSAPAEAVPLDAALAAALATLGTTLREAGVEVDVSLGDPAPLVRVEPAQFTQVLAHLLANARDALAERPAGQPRRIRIAAAPGEAGMLRLTMADTGGGIAPAVLARLFEPFATTKAPDRGEGLGLAICLALLRGMGGDIEGHNGPEGAVFTLTLPLCAEAPCPA